MNHKCPYCGKEIICVLGFNDYIEELIISKNKPAFIMNSLQSLHNLPSDSDEIYNYVRLSGIIKHAHNDYAYLLKVIWDTASVGIVGSHLNYIDAVVCRKIKLNGADGKRPVKTGSNLRNAKDIID